MKPPFFGASIQWRVVYALAASLLWWALVELNQFWLGDTWSYPFYGTGAVYTALVLVPYLPNVRGLNLVRAFALLLCGAFSYWMAVVFLASEWLSMPDFMRSMGDGIWFAYSMGIAGTLGAVIVGIGARLLVPLTLRWSGWLMLLGAGLLGGVALGLGVNAGISAGGRISYEHWLPGHVAWQVMVCLALYYGSENE